VADSGVGGQLDARAELLEAYCHARSEGCGRPVDREVLERSEAVSDTFLKRVVAVARELRGDGSRLLSALRDRSDPRLRGFRTSSAEALEEFLSREGFLDERALLSQSEVTVRLLATPAAVQLPEGIAAACSHRWWQLSPSRPTRDT
jgi:hypothetical protein